MSYLDLHKYKKKEVSLPPIEEHAPKMQQRPRIPQRKRIMAPISPSYLGAEGRNSLRPSTGMGIEQTKPNFCTISHKPSVSSMT